MKNRHSALAAVRRSANADSPAIEPQGEVRPDQFARLLPAARTEQLIAVARLLLGLGGLVALLGDEPDGLGNLRGAAFILLAYSLYATVILLGLRFARPVVLRYRLPVHALDLAAFAALVLASGRTSSPFFTPVVFLILAATLRWQEKGALRTGAAALALLAAAHVYDASAGTAVLDTVLVRYAFLAAMTLLLFEAGRIARQHSLRLMHLAGWPQTNSTDRQETAAAVLAHAATVVGADRAVLVWEDPEEPWPELYSWSRMALSRSRLPGVSLDSIVAPDLQGAPFLWESGRPDRAVVYLRDGHPVRYAGEPVDPAMTRLLDSSNVFGLALSGDEVSGHLFLLDVPAVTGDDLHLGEVLSRQVSDTLQHFVLAEQLRALSAADERVRLSRDLHDGLLQTLTGIALRLATVRRLVGSDPAQAAVQLESVEQLIVNEQRDLRFLTIELRLRSGRATEGVLFPQALGGLLDRASKVWGITVEWKEHEAAAVPPSLAWETYQLVHEAVVNAARHGRAGRVELRFAAELGALRVGVSDDGSGFAFRGSFDLRTLQREKRGPKSLRERVEALGGDMRISSSEKGADIEILIPVDRAVA